MTTNGIASNPASSVGPAAVTAGAAARSVGGLVGRELMGGIVPLLVLLALWMVVFWAVPENTFLKSPIEVAGFLMSGGELGVLLSALGSTLTMVVLGYAVAICVSISVATVIVMSSIGERAVMPLAVIVGSIPIIVITPVLLMLVGRGVLTAVLVCTVVTFFPSLINVIAGMRSPATQLLDVTEALGASRWRTLLHVRFPSSVPGLISASKLALPAALSGVILTEFIATATGVGNYINHARANFMFEPMWSGIAMTLVASVLIYSVLGAIEIGLQRKYAPLGDKRKKVSP